MSERAQAQDPWDEALASRRSRAYWRSLEELLDTPELRAAQGQEFPEGKTAPADGLSRRDFVGLLGASMALAGLAGCVERPREKILPYTIQPPDVAPGVPAEYATSLVLDGHAVGVIVRSHAGRPVKIEGNPEHPASGGATSIYEQAAILGLYDPGRARAVRQGRAQRTYASLVTALAARRTDGGAGLRFLLEPTSSPTVGALVARVARRYPGARFTFHSPLDTGHARAGAALAFGRPLAARHDLSRAAVLLSLDSDFLSPEAPGAVAHARQFAARRRLERPGDAMSRLHVVEAAPTSTGTMADHRLRRRPSAVRPIAAAIVARLLADGGGRLPGVPDALRAALARLAPPELPAEDAAFVTRVARDLVAHAGDALVLAGERQPPEVHLLAHLANAIVASPDAAWTIEPPHIDAGAAAQDPVALAADLRAGRVDTLIVLEGNPSYAMPADLDFGALLRAVPTTVYLGLYENETAADALWFVPAAHPLEAWGDARAADGTVSFQQPLVAPLTGGRTPAELLALFASETAPIVPPTAHALVREVWREAGVVAALDFESFWQRGVQRGFLPGSALPRVEAPLDLAGAAAALERAAAAAGAPPDAGAIELALAPSPTVLDGRFANNAWLQELPAPVTKLTWDNALELSPRTAVRLGVTSEELVEVSAGGRAVRAPVLVVPGHADDAVTLRLGYGRAGAEAVARDVGVSATPLRTSAAPWIVPGAAVRKVGGRRKLAHTQTHFSMSGRAIALKLPLEELRREPHALDEHRGPVASLLPDAPKAGDQWAMSIDLSLCTGCSACMVACQAENNVPVVGKAGVARSREMHWLRIDTYQTGTADEPGWVHQPMLCQHCEKAPCEYVCPVNATVHSPDGLNEMVYNRCVGTRFCSNNCPYKVRRFNFFDYVDRSLVQLARNPDVTVRERGVMEKCTYCVQRIRAVDRQARRDGRPVRDGEVVTACQQACPTRAIAFGSLADAASEVNRWRGRAQSYEVLHEQGTRPRTHYLARIDNPGSRGEGG